MSSEVQEILLEVNGLHFTALNSGPETGELVLLLHGFPQFADAWTPLLETLGAAGYRAVAVDQRGYAAGARPAGVEAYDLPHLTADVLGFADVLGASTFHFVGHDWGGLLAWVVAAQSPQRLRSVTSLATPHLDAFLHAALTDPDQMWRSKYIPFFKLPGNAAEKLLLADEGKALHKVYQGKVSEPQLSSNVRRLLEPGALTAMLNWYRALELGTRIGKVAVPTLYIWGDEDFALGKTAAFATKNYVDAPYRFERLAGYSHWLLEEAPGQIAALLLDHLRATA